MPLAGRQLSIGWALALCHHVGFRGHELSIAVALMTAESGRFIGAWHDNIDESGEITSTDRGLFQINDKWHPGLADEDAYQAIPNAAYAYFMSSGQFFGPWMAYVNKAHEKYIPLVWAVRVLGRWKRKLHRVETEFA